MKHIETAIVSDRPGVTYGCMYSMHKYWSKKSPDVIGAYIETYTREGDIVLDPFCGSGIVACEAVRRGRRAIAIDINPMATFITRMTLTPVNLSRLKWALRDMKNACETAVDELFVTKCSRCRKDALIEFIVRDGDDPKQIAYKCICSKERLFKEPNAKDKRADHEIGKRKITFWYPKDVLLPIIQKERFKYLHELFTKRNLIALSIILNAIEKIDDSKIRDVMKLAFTAALDKCSRLKPLSRASGRLYPSLSEGWVSVRFYAPKMWQEVNPWLAFTRSFERVYKGKKESNVKLKNVVLVTSCAEVFDKRGNVAVVTGSADDILNQKLSRRRVDYVLTDPPFGDHIQYLALSTLWGAWLKLDFDYSKELIVNRYRGKTRGDYERYTEEILKAIRKVMKPKSHIHIFFHDIRGPYLHRMLQSMKTARISPQQVLHQPPPKSFGAGVRGERAGRGKGKGLGHYGSYVVRGRALDKLLKIRDSSINGNLRKKVAEAARKGLEIYDGISPVATILHSVYQNLCDREIFVFAKHEAEDFLKESIKQFATIEKNLVKAKDREVFRGKTPLEKEIQKAVLDAKAIYPEHKNQIYQSVLWRFREKGITLENIRKVVERTEPQAEKAHLKKRYHEILLLLGKQLGFRGKLAAREPNRIIWKGPKGETCSFLIKDKEISVRACRRMPKKTIVSEIGIISYRKLEYGLHQWCNNNVPRGDDIKKHLNPMPQNRDTRSAQKTPRLLALRVLKNKEVCPEHYLLTVQIPKGQNTEPRPGQFFHIICDPDGEKTLSDNDKERGYALTLRRPFSVHRINYENFNRLFLATPTMIPYEIKDLITRPVSSIDFLYKVVGEGTRNLSKVRSGSYLGAIGPIGTGFAIEKVDTAIIVAGGIGVAPMVALAERLRYLGSKVFLYFGALRSELLWPILSRADSAVGRGFANGTPEFLAVIKSEFKEIGAKQVRVCTDDESLGEKGPVTHLLERDMKSDNLPMGNSTIYACGPSDMLKAVSVLANENKVPCQVLLEERMACGIGACFSCTCHTWGKNRKEERKRVCVDGPVFDSEEIKWPD